MVFSRFKKQTTYFEKTGRCYLIMQKYIGLKVIIIKGTVH